MHLWRGSLLRIMCRSLLLLLLIVWLVLVGLGKGAFFLGGLIDSVEGVLVSVGGDAHQISVHSLI